MATMEFAVVGNSVTLKHGGVKAVGQQASGTVVLEADGKEHAIPQSPWRHCGHAVGRPASAPEHRHERGGTGARSVVRVDRGAVLADARKHNHPACG